MAKSDLLPLPTERHTWVARGQLQHAAEDEAARRPLHRDGQRLPELELRAEGAGIVTREGGFDSG